MMNFKKMTSVEMIAKFADKVISLREIKHEKIFHILETTHGTLIFDKLPNFRSKNGFLVLKNSDFCEGRGPMLVDKLFGTLDKAVNYIMDNKGIYGSAQRLSVNIGVNVYGEVYAYHSFNGYEIKVMEIE